MSDRLPLTAEEIDPAWLDAVLAERHPGVAVASVEVVERHELTNAHARLAVAYHFDAGAPTTLFAKLPPSEPARRESIAATGMGRSEVRFYNNLAPRTALGGRCIGFDEAWSAHRLHAAYTVPASCQIVTFPDNQSEGRRVFSQAFLGRAEAAITDLDALGAISDALS